MMKKMSLLALSVFLFSTLGIYYVGAADKPLQTDQISIINQKGEKHIFHVELATTRRQHQIGLMHRKHLDKNAGMLFLFPSAEKQAFWMKNTYIPLDILYLKETGHIGQIYKMTTPLSTKPLPSSFPGMAVLEINGGISDHLGIKEGDVVQHPIFNTKDAQ